MVPKGRITVMGLVLIRAATGRLAFVLPPTTPITTTTTRLQLAKPPTRSRICGGGRGVGHVQQKHARSATTPTMTTISIHGYSARNGIRGIRSTRLFCSAGGVGVVAMSTEHNIQAMMADDEQEQCDGLVARPREQEGLTDIQPVLRKYLEMDNDGSVKKVALKARQHVNPLSFAFQIPVEMPDGWFRRSYQNPTAPLHVDIGCAKAAFVGSMAQAFPARNFLGLEIRRPVAAFGLRRTMVLGLKNCFVVCCNANIDLDPLLSEAAERGAAIDTISIQFPDPCFKSKKQKRRVLQVKREG